MRVTVGLLGLTHIRSETWSEPLLQNRVPVHVTHVREALDVTQVRTPLLGVGFQQLPTEQKHEGHAEGQTGHKKNHTNAL